MEKMLGADHPMEAHKIDSRGMYFTGKSADAKEGIESFLEKRPAKFPWRSAKTCLPFSCGGRIENSFKSVIFERRIQTWFKESREGCNDKTFTIAILGGNSIKRKHLERCFFCALL